MNGINKVTIEQVSIKDPQDGQWGQWWSYGIKVNGEWWNGSLKSQEQVDGMMARKGQEVELFFWVDSTKDPKYANKVRFVTDKDRKEQPKPVEEAPKVDFLNDEYKSIPHPESQQGLLKRIEALEKSVDILLENATGLSKPIEQSKIETPDADERLEERKQMDDLPF